MPKPFRFFAGGIGAVRGAGELGETARRAEALGYDGLLIADHIVEMLAPLPALAAAAALTERIKLGVLVLNNSFRNPVVLAHELLALDNLSGGRVIAGIGAGWARQEYELAGIPFGTHAERADALEANVGVLKRLLQGREGWPRPVQQPRPPIQVGAGGRRLLEFAAREVEIVGLAPRMSRLGDPSHTPAATDEKIAWIRAAAGERREDLEIHTYVAFTGGARVTDDARGALADILAWVHETYGPAESAEDLLASPHIFIGSVDAIVEHCLEVRERWGINGFSFGAQFEELAPVVARLAGL